MRLFEFDDSEEIEENPLSSDIGSLLLRLDASQIKKVKLSDFIEELNNILNVPIDPSDTDEINNLKQLIANTGKADIKGDYIIMDYQSPESPNETESQKIAMKNVKDKASKG